ncbi:PaaI family thioesterase [Sneathiella marina]|uniref:PaaI family thioesterase n=1 Tax=Sneathiella marina TaxID=2950108 RepID=A0ABY4VYC6_9PROT|nr:PaaI family thioesterase [Sneathiella marina]USG59692.1 PaaI family thioesterase [Sneathiella marina]
MKKNIGKTVIPEGFEEVTGAAPFANRNGPYYEKKIDDETSIRAFRAAEKHLNGVKLVHGGMLMSFADSALARGVIRATGRRCVTIKMNSEFLSPAREGDWIEAFVEVTKSTKTVVFVRGELKVGRRTIFKADAIFHYVHIGRD